MKQIVRAGGFAVAALALATGATYADPSMAVEARSTPAVSYMAHADAGVASGSTGVARPAMPSQQTMTGIAQQAVSVAFSAVPRTRSLAELVDAYAAADVDEAEQACLAKAVYFEARSEPLEGQLAVADVVLNRAASGQYPRTICEVVTQKAQFSFIRNGRFPHPDMGSRAWYKAVAVARIARERLHAAVPRDVLWYHADYVAPVWRNNLTRVEKIGAHIFYGPLRRG